MHKIGLTQEKTHWRGDLLKLRNRILTEIRIYLREDISLLKRVIGSLFKRGLKTQKAKRDLKKQKDDLREDLSDAPYLRENLCKGELT